MPQPKLLSKPWASDGLKNNIPAERNGGLAQEAATYAEGFPSITMTPISVGGKPPSGKDMNGVLYEISAHTVWQNQGGRYRFDQAFCDTIGGYPKGAVLINDTLDTEYISLLDANTHNPNSGNNTGKWAIHAGKGLKASTTQAGIVRLSSATDSNSEELAATPKAVKAAYDKAVAAKEAADGAVKTTGNQEIAGDKTFTGLTTLKKGAIVADSVGDFAANQYLQIGSNNVNSYFYNKRSGKYLSMRNDGELRYDGKRLLNADDLSGMVADLQRKANRDEVAPKSHTHRAAEITDFAEAVAALTVYQKIGTFDICRLPDGTQIESGTVRIQNHNNNPTARVLTWPLAFVTAPVVVAALSGPEGNVRDIWVTIDSGQSNRSAVHYWVHEQIYNTPDVTVNFVAIGRWK